MSLKIGGSWRTLSAMLRYPCVIFYYHNNQRIANCCAWFLDIPMTWLWSQYDAMFNMVIDLWRHWYMSMADSICHAPPIFNDITNWICFSTETSDFLKQIFLKWVYIFHHPRMHVMSIWCHTDVNLVSYWVRCYIMCLLGYDFSDCFLHCIHLSTHFLLILYLKTQYEISLPFLLTEIEVKFYRGFWTRTVTGIYPVGIWCQNDVVSMWRHHAASTLIRRHFHVMCLLGRIID